MKQYIVYPMWSNPRYKTVSILSALATFLYALVWTFNYSLYNSSLPVAWMVVSLPLLVSLFWYQTLTIGEATFFYYERFFGYTVSDSKSVDLSKLHIRDEKQWICVIFNDTHSRIVTDFYQNKKRTPTLRSPFSHEKLTLQQDH